MKAIIFDCYGVLVGTGIWAIYQHLGGDPVKDANYLDNWLNKLNLGKISADEFAEAMGKILNIDPEAYKQAVKEDEILNQELITYIRSKLKPRYKLAMVSNANSQAVRKQLGPDCLGLFDEVLISEEVGMVKPQKEFFDLALKRLGVNANDAIFVDDHQKYLDGAKNAGLKTLLYTTFESFKPELEAHL